MNSFFSRDNWIWSPFSWIADMVILSCLWVICSIPLLTIGASTAALYDCAARCVRGGDEKMFARFFRTFRRELVQSIPSLLLWCVVIAGGYAAISAYGNNVTVTGTSTAITTGLLLLLTVVVGIAAWVYPLLSRFTMSFTSLNLMAVRLALIHLPRTMALGIATVLSAFLCLQFIAPLFFLPAILVWIWTLLLEGVFRTYEDSNET